MADHQHVVKRPDGWAVRGQGNSRYTARGIATQEEARQRAEQIARNPPLPAKMTPLHPDRFNHQGA